MTTARRIRAQHRARIQRRPRKQAAYGGLAQFSDAEGLKKLGDQVGLVGAENVTIDCTSAVPNPPVEVVLDNGSHGLHVPIIAAPLKVSSLPGR